MKAVLLLIFTLMIAAMPLSVAAVPKAAEDEDGTVVRMDPQVSKPRTAQKTGQKATFAPANGKKAAGRAATGKGKKNTVKKAGKSSKKRKK